MTQAVERRLRGKARDREEVLREYNEYNERRKQAVLEKWGPSAHVLWQLLAPEPSKIFRWRIQLECGCIEEAATYGEDRRPDALTMYDYINGTELPQGQVICHRDDHKMPAPYRAITAWGARREVEFPADPVEPPDWWPDGKATVWAKRRYKKRHSKAFWKVTLECGHVTEVCTGPAWKPEDGPKRVNAARLAEMVADFEQAVADGHVEDEVQREHWRRMLADGWPSPQTEQMCFRCPEARRVVAYQRVGWLAHPVGTRTPVPAGPSKPELEQKLRTAERQAHRLRAQLAAMRACQQGDTE